MFDLQEYFMIFFIVGAVMFLIEALLPGVGVVGLTGLISFIIGIIIVSPSMYVATVLIILLIVVSVGIFVFLIKNLPDSLVLKKSFTKKEGFSTSKDNSDYIGKTMKAITYLRPSGKVEYNQMQFDAMTRGEFVDTGKNVEVIDVNGYTLVVKSTEE